jgi:hypothetical protein
LAVASDSATLIDCDEVRLVARGNIPPRIPEARRRAGL